MEHRNRIGRRVGGGRTGAFDGFLVFWASFVQADFGYVKLVDRRIDAAWLRGQLPSMVSHRQRPPKEVDMELWLGEFLSRESRC